jgi:hypothetical protein
LAVAEETGYGSIQAYLKARDQSAVLTRRVDEERVS